MHVTDQMLLCKLSFCDEGGPARYQLQIVAAIPISSMGRLLSQVLRYHSDNDISIWDIDKLLPALHLTSRETLIQVCRLVQIRVHATSYACGCCTL